MAERQNALIRSSVAGSPSLTEHGETPYQSEFAKLLNWLLGLVLLLVCGWGGIGLAYYLARHYGMVRWDLVVWAAATISLALLVFLERDFWLSHLLGMRVRPGAAAWRSAFSYWLLGVPGLSLRAQEAGPAPQPAPETNGEPASARSAAAKTRTEPVNQTSDSFREIVETIVFVVVLVLLLKSFVAEAFVIPTGSMAETLYGYQKLVKCPKCAFTFPVNCSSEVDPQGGPPSEVTGGICPNCRYEVHFAKDYKEKSAWPTWNTGDRVLVAKFLYDLNIGGLDSPDRYQVVVFKYPDTPQSKYIPLNYIKRLIGLQRETIAINRGKLYRYEGLNYDEVDADVPPLDLWRREHMHMDDPKAIALFEQGKFQILRKPAKQVLAEERIVFDNDYQPSDLVGKARPRWYGQPNNRSWTYDKEDEPKIFQHGQAPANEVDWLRYQNLMPNSDRSSARVELITDFMGYNAGFYDRHGPPGENWVGDLLLECDVQTQASAGELVLELSKGMDRFRARWDLVTGRCTLSRWNGEKEMELGVQETTVKGTGSFHLRFANVDDRLLIWVNSALPFGEGVPYEPSQNKAPYAKNDFEPASIGVKQAAVTVSHVKLWRDTYYTANLQGAAGDAERRVDFGDPNDWGQLAMLPVRTYYVQPGHFLCLGDNSPESSDGRSWGLVPRRLLLGRALLKYYPFSRWGRIE